MRLNSITDYETLACISTEFYKGVLFAKFWGLNSEDDNFVFRKFKVLIAEPIKDLGLSNFRSGNKKEIVSIYNTIIDYISNKLKEVIVSSDQDQLVIFLYSVASYMTKIHYYMELSINGSLLPEKILHSEFFDEDEKKILFYVIGNKDRLSHLFRSFKGFDKAIIQTLLYYYGFGRNKSIRGESLNLKSFSDLYELAASLIILINDREFITSGFYKNGQIHIIENEIKFINDLNKNKIEILMKKMSEDSIQENLFFDDSVISALEPEFNKEYGFKIKTIEKIFQNKSSSEIFNRKKMQVIVIEYKKLVELLRKEGYCSKPEAENIIKYFTLQDLSIDFIYDSSEKLKSRIFEHPIVEYKDQHYLLSYNLFRFAIDILKTKMTYDLLDGCKNKNPRKVEKKVKEHFEKMVKEKIERQMDYCTWNFQDFEIINNGKKKRVHLNNQIDVIGVRGGKLYIFECKDIYYKFTSTGVRSDIKKTINFIKHFEGKIMQVNLYKKELINYLKCDFSEIVPVLVFKNYNSTQDSEVDTNGIQLVSYGQLQDWVRNLT
ncbi:NERD domain-containing protein [Paenibacillus eucommiae]|uniref:Holliday junction resolvase n=1 Tax=Paenibacillus eucommiae TaxID=1355755 RepID=A0ABS4J7M0_9BACL|nr:NERD domain-containing protein [Paenibacillus eucommiae]MBP1995818.1 Holliday junction resolvase [Paenibacillus eucommiae]